MNIIIMNIDSIYTTVLQTQTNKQTNTVWEGREWHSIQRRQGVCVCVCVCVCACVFIATGLRIYLNALLVFDTLALSTVTSDERCNWTNSDGFLILISCVSS